jgi:hypothetical protein
MRKKKTPKNTNANSKKKAEAKLQTAMTPAQNLAPIPVQTSDSQYRRPDETRILFAEAGTSGLKTASGFIYEAYNAQLYWPGVQPLYSKLRRSMPEMVMIRQAFTSWARAIKPQVELPEKPTDDDKRYQEFVLSDFDNMDGGFGKLIDTIVNHVPFYGWGWWDVQRSIRDPEWVPYKKAVKEDTEPSVENLDEWRSEEDDGLLGVRRIDFRDTSTFNGWLFDKSKRMIGMRQQDYPNPPVDLHKDKSLHLTFGDPNNPEGLSPLEAVWRLERIRYGYEAIMGIGAEHSAGHLSVKKTTQGELSSKDSAAIARAAMNLLSAQEGNYAYWPFGLEGQILDIPFQAGTFLLEVIKHYSIAALSVFSMQWIALNTMTSTGAQASQVDSTDTAIFTFNSMIDGFASQYDAQVGRRLWEWNKDSFPNVTKRPKITFSHVDRTLALSELGQWLTAINGIIPLGPDDHKAIRSRSGFMPTNNPEFDLESSRPDETVVDEEDDVIQGYE